MIEAVQADAGVFWCKVKKKKGNKNERHIYLVIPSAMCRNSPIMKRFRAHSEN